MDIENLAQLIASNQSSAKNELIKFLADADHNDINELISEFSYTEEGEGIDNMFELLGVEGVKAFLKRQLEDEGAGLYSGTRYLVKHGVDVNEPYEGVPVVLLSAFKSETSYSEDDEEPFDDDWSEEVDTQDSLRIYLLDSGADFKLLEGEGYFDFISALSASEYSICDAFIRAGYQLKPKGLYINGEAAVSELQYVLEDDYSDNDALEMLYDEIFSDWNGASPLDEEDSEQANHYINSYLRQKSMRIEYLLKHGATEGGLYLIDTDLDNIFSRSLNYLKQQPTWGLFGSRGFNLKAFLERHFPEFGTQPDNVDGEALLKMLFEAREKIIRDVLSS